jgi:hypothetical protein
MVVRFFMISQALLDTIAHPTVPLITLALQDVTVQLIHQLLTIALVDNTRTQPSKHHAKVVLVVTIALLEPPLTTHVSTLMVLSNTTVFVHFLNVSLLQAL